MPLDPTQAARLIDTHAHLDMPEFEKDLPQVIERAHGAGVGTIVIVGTDPASCTRTIEIAEHYPHIFAILGVHPHNAAEVQERDLEQLQVLAQHEKVRAWGEIGLDFFRNLSPQPIQKERFRQQIAIAKGLKLPVVIHSRAATEETIACLKEEKASEVGGVIHCFSGDQGAAKRYLEIGFVLSIPGVITFPKNQTLRDVVKGLPADGFIVETDCPFLTPAPHRGKRNEPAYVRLTAEAVARVRGESLAQIATQTTETACRVFNITVE
jgi:TatD DNase family protein